MPTVYSTLTDKQKARVDQVMGHSPGVIGKLKMKLGYGSSKQREYHAARVKADTGMVGGPLYQQQNVVGYTGDPKNPGSVYYMDQTSKGRITLQHDYPTNEGRSPRSSLTGYEWKNESGVQVEYEYRGEKKVPVHTSRSTRTVVYDDKEQQRLHSMGQHMQRKDIYKRLGPEQFA